MFRVRAVWAFALVFAFVLNGCDEFLPGGEEDPPESGAAEGAFAFVTAESGAVTTALTLVFDAAVEGLTAGDITLTALDGGNPGITRGTLRPGGSPFVYTLDVDGVTAEGSVEVAVTRNGSPVAGSPRTATVHYGAQPVAFTGLSANGPYTTALTLTFGEPGIPGLTLNDVYLNAGGTGAAPGDPADTSGGKGTSYRIGVNGVTAGGGIIVGVNKSGFSAFPPILAATVSRVLMPLDTVVEITGPGSTGATQAWSPPVEGYYRIELWGSQGWNPATDSSNQYGGRGAYVRGIMEITEGEKGQPLYVTVGIGANPAQVAYGEGWGGGASDARWGADTLYDRIIVAAGGGGAHNRARADGGQTGYSTGGFGGALTGGNASNGTQNGLGGSQTAGGAGGGGGHSQHGVAGAFGTGGDAFIVESIGSGGYGYWGGGSGGYNGANGGGGGGSSFISGYAGCAAITGSGNTTPKTDSDATVKATHYSGKVFVPSVIIGGTEYTTVMIAGNAEMPAPDGGSETGHSGGGYARVTYLGKPAP
jgi:hypothetical protein